MKTTIIKACNFRGLRTICWNPPGGASVIIGPNGSGKTTLLDVVWLLADIYRYGFAEAIRKHGGADAFKNLRVSATDAVELGVGIGDLTWTVLLRNQEDLNKVPLNHSFEEVVTNQGQTILRRELGQSLFQYRDTQVSGAIQDSGKNNLPADAPALRIAYEGTSDKLLKPFITSLLNYKFHRSYDMWTLMEHGSTDNSDVLELDVGGRNLFAVLRNWRIRRLYSEKYEYLIEVLRKAFPQNFYKLFFDVLDNRVIGSIEPPRLNGSVPAKLISAGWWHAILNLCALLSTEAGGILALEEPENTMHPIAISHITQSVIEWSSNHNITTMVSTHSPDIVSHFKKANLPIFILEDGQIKEICLGDKGMSFWPIGFFEEIS